MAALAYDFVPTIQFRGAGPTWGVERFMVIRLKVLFAALILTLLAMPAWAQQTTTDDAITNYESAAHQFFQGIPSDWSNSHVVYSKPEPGSDTEDAVQKDPRYWLQQIRRSMQAAGDQDAADFTADLSAKKKKKAKKNKKTSTLTGLWSVNLGAGVTVGAEMFPATFTAGSSASCTNDFVVYNTGLLGSGTVAATGTGTLPPPHLPSPAKRLLSTATPLTATGVGTDTITAEPTNTSTTTIDGVAYKVDNTTTSAPHCSVRRFRSRLKYNLRTRTTWLRPLTTPVRAPRNALYRQRILALRRQTNAANVVIVTNTAAAAIAWELRTSNQTLAPTTSISEAVTSGTDFALSANPTTAAANLASAINNNSDTDVTATSDRCHGQRHGDHGQERPATASRLPKPWSLFRGAVQRWPACKPNAEHRWVQQHLRHDLQRHGAHYQLGV